MSDALGEDLHVLACRIAGRPTGPPPPDTPECAGRRRLLLAAALLTARGDLAQDAVHVALTRLCLGPAADPGDGLAAHREVLRAVRRSGVELTAGPSDRVPE